MKKIFWGILLLSFNSFAQDFSCQPKQEIKWEEISDGVAWAKYDLAFRPYDKTTHTWAKELSRSVTVRAFKLNLEKNKLMFHRPEKDLSCDVKSEQYIKNMIQDHGGDIIGAINASFFVMPNGKVLGLALDESRVWSRDLNTQTISSSGVFLIKDGKPTLQTRDRFIEKYGTTLSDTDAAQFTFAVQAYPRLLKDEVMQITDNVQEVRRPRTSLGFGEDLNEIILVTIDARGESNATGMSLFEYAHLVKTPDCGVYQKTALNLDGGGSTAFAIPKLSVYEQADNCRHLGNILTIQKR